jgi:hypothetical protein
MPADFDPVLEQDRDILPVPLVEPGVAVDVDLDKRDVKRPQGGCHLLAEVAVPASVQDETTLCRQARRW